MASKFSATGPSLGYLYQVRYALLLLLQDNRDECFLSIEHLDDVAFEENGSPSELLQLKHHLNNKASLTDASPDIWKTIRVWSEEVYRQNLDPSELQLTLITTAQAKEYSIAALLHDDDKRNTIDATNKLVEVANKSTNDALSTAFKKFLALNKQQREQLINAVYIVDNSPNIVDLPQKIKRKLLGIHPDHRNGAYEQIEGWWFDKAVKHLSSSLPTTISRDELEYKISDIAQQYGENVLPIHFGPKAGVEPKIPPDADQRMFVEQLRAVGLSPERVELAIVDYYRAFEQRSKWARLELLYDDEMEKYENKLVEEWKRFSLSYKDELDSDATETELRRCGRAILNHMGSINIPIRERVTEEYVMRGNYHILADNLKGALPRVLWHPKFLERVEAILSMPGI